MQSIKKYYRLNKATKVRPYALILVLSILKYISAKYLCFKLKQFLF